MRRRLPPPHCQDTTSPRWGWHAVAVRGVGMMGRDLRSRHADAKPTACHPNRSGSNARRGMTLLEVVLALAIFFVAMAAIYHLIDLGRRNALESRLQSQAVFKAEQVMSEVVAGARPMQSTGEAPFPAGSLGSALADISPTAPRSGAWTWSLSVVPWGLDATMLEVMVTVRHRTSAGVENAAFTLRRVVRDPVALATLQADLEAAQAELEAAEATEE